MCGDLFHPNAILYMGDSHATQGSAEWSGAAIEIRAETICTIALTDGGPPISGPRTRTPDTIWAIGTATPRLRGIGSRYGRRIYGGS